MTPRDILRALSRVMVREKVVEEEKEDSPTSAKSRLSGRLSDATGAMGRLSMGSPGEPGDISMASARSVELQRRVSVMSRLSNATRISDIFHTTAGDEDGGQTPVLTPYKQGQMLPEMDLEFGEEIRAMSSDEDFGGVVDYDDFADIEEARDVDPEQEDEPEQVDMAESEAAPFSPPPEDVVDEGTGEEAVEEAETAPEANLELDSPEEEPPVQTGEPMFSDEEVPAQPTATKKVVRRPRRKRPAEDLPPSIFPRTFLKSLVASISGENVDKSVIEELVATSDMFFDQAADDLAAYADHCKRKTVEPKDVVQLMRRQRLINDSSDVLPLAQRHLPAELIAELSDVFTIRAPKRRSKKAKPVEEAEEVGEEVEETFHE
ncbi:hypothetical protein CJU89_1598 [Yarrowia sp. B02]|nr:hypothetical protein CJU89_1598 [Yarrowia sp. B02]